jgi:5-formyltetrahydrofolate cyclo-ligase
MVKKLVRKEYIEKRNLLTDKMIADFHDRIVNNFRTIDLQGIQQLLSYYPIPERKEFNTVICEQLLVLENEGMQVSWPRLEADGVTMDAVLLGKDMPLIKNSFNIYEPSGDEIIGPQLIDAVFVPLLAFDTRGYRVGYGKGFYDRYLKRCAQDVVKIGFSYFEAIDNIDDIDEFDVPLNYCITPMRVYEF